MRFVLNALVGRYGATGEDAAANSSIDENENEKQEADKNVEAREKLPLSISIAPELEDFRLIVSESRVKAFMENENISEESKQMALKLQFQLAKVTKCWVHMRLMRELAVKTYTRPWFKREMLKNQQRFFLPAEDHTSSSPVQ
ncbi:uncharacterized protein LOC141908561 [Tubulanus polymorphus]|uniref:uncharacterized protein LOC141908561 n=1 Tax=Tubulanus polymorphus TaxID=672921 RepID=UPI003DA5C4B5